MVTKIAETNKLKRNTKKSKTNEETEEEEEAPVPTTFCIQFFPILKCTSTISKVTNQVDSMRTSFLSPTTSRELSLNKKKFALRVYDYRYFFDETIDGPLSELFSVRKMKMLSRPEGFNLFGKLGVFLFSTSELLYPNMRIRLRLIRARPKCYKISDNPNICLRNVHCSFYSNLIALKDNFRKKRMENFAYNPEEFNCLATLAKNFIISPRQNQ